MAGSYKTRILWNGRLIPVTFHPAIKKNELRLNQLREGDYRRIRYKKVCGHGGDEVDPEEIVRGFEYQENEYILLADEELDNLKQPEESYLRVTKAIKPSDVPLYALGKSYHVVPNAGSERAMESIRRALKQRRKLAVAQVILGYSEIIFLLIPSDRGVIAVSMAFSEEYREAPKDTSRWAVEKEEVRSCTEFLDSISGDLDWTSYHDTYYRRVLNLLEHKAQKRETVQSVLPEVVIHTEDGLRRTAEHAEAQKAVPKPAGNRKSPPAVGG